jgi:hypothetical protein
MDDNKVLNMFTPDQKKQQKKILPPIKRKPSKPRYNMHGISKELFVYTPPPPPYALSGLHAHDWRTH